MKAVKAVRLIRIINRILNILLFLTAVALILLLFVQSEHMISYIGIVAVFGVIISFSKMFFVGRENKTICKYILAKVTSVIKEGGINSFSLECVLIEQYKHIIIEVLFKEELPGELCLKCHDEVENYLEKYSNYKNKTITVNIRMPDISFVSLEEG